jgi:predicted GNAT family acetyltransferase
VVNSATTRSFAAYGGSCAALSRFNKKQTANAIALTNPFDLPSHIPLSYNRGMRLFGRSNAAPEMVTTGRFEMEQEGQVAYLEYAVSDSVLELRHTEVPASVRGHGLSSALIKSALDWARENHKKVDVICPTVAGYLKNHPEYADLLLK